MSQLTRDEQYTLMSLFLICRSPLMFGGNLPDNDKFTEDLITNDEALAVLQKSRNNRLLFDDGETIAWIADDGNTGAKYVALFFLSDQKPILENNALWNSKLLTHKTGEQSEKVTVNIAGAKKLYLVVSDGGNGSDWDHADWIEPKLTGKNGTLNVTDLKWISATAGWGNATINSSVGGNALVVDNKTYSNGIGTHSNSIIEYDIPEGYEKFSALAGLDRECVSHPEGATVKFHVFTQYPCGTLPEDSIRIGLKLEQLGLKGRCEVRDLWAKSDLGEYTGEIPLIVKKHGARLIKVLPR